MATKNKAAKSPLKGVTVAQIRKVADSMGVTAAIANTAQSWGIMAVAVAHACAYLTASEAYAAMRPIAKLLGNTQADSIALKGMPRIHPFSANGGLASQFAAGKASATFYGVGYDNLHSYHPINFVGRNYIAALAANFDGCDVAFGTSDGVIAYPDKGSNKRGASYPDNKAVTGETPIGLLVGDTLAIQAILGKAKPKPAKVASKPKRGRKAKASKPANNRRSEAAKKAAATRKRNAALKAKAQAEAEAKANAEAEASKTPV